MKQLTKITSLLIVSTAIFLAFTAQVSSQKNVTVGPNNVLSSPSASVFYASNNPPLTSLTNALSTWTGSTNLPSLTGNNTFSGTNTFTGNVTTGNLTVNGTLTGNGSGLTSMNATQLTSGTVNSSRLPDAGLGAGSWGGSGKWTQIQTDAKGRVTFATDGSLGSAALSNTTDFVAASNGTATNLTINGTTTFGNATQARSALGLGTLATQNGTLGTAGSVNLSGNASQFLNGSGNWTQATTTNASQLTSGTLSATLLPTITINLSGVIHNTPLTITNGVGNATLANQTANTVLAGPTSGNATTPTFRALVASDIPAGITTFSNANVNLTANSRFAVQTGNLTQNRTATLPPASSVAAGARITFRDGSKTATPTTNITVTANGSDTIAINDATTPTPSSIAIDSPGSEISLTSDGSGVWSMNDSIVARRIYIPASANGNPSNGIFFNNYADGTSITWDTSQLKLRLASRRIDFLPLGVNGDSFIQLFNNAFDNAYLFFSRQGAASAGRVNSPSHAIGFASSWWNGSTSVDKISMVRGNTDSSGNPYLSVFANGSSTQPQIGTWPQTTDMTCGTESTRFTASGIDLLGNRLLNVGTGGLSFTGNGSADTINNLGGTGGRWTSNNTTGLASSGNNTDISTLKGLNGAPGTPALTTASNPTTGYGFFGTNFELTRNGTVLIYSDATYGTIIGALPLTVNNRIQVNAGSAAYPSLMRTDNPGYGVNVSSSDVGVAVASAYRQTWTSNGTTIGANGTNVKQIRHGSATLVNGTVTVSDSTVSTSARIMLTRSAINASTAVGTLGTGTITASTSFVVNSRKSDTTVETGDQSTVQYLIIEP